MWYWIPVRLELIFGSWHGFMSMLGRNQDSNAAGRGAFDSLLSRILFATSHHGMPCRRSFSRGGGPFFRGVGPSRSADPQQKSRPKRILAFVDRSTADPNGGGFEKVRLRSLAKPILAVLTQTVAHQASLFDASFPQAPLSHATFSPISCF